MTERPSRQPQQTTFEDFLLRAVDDALTQNFDSSTAKAMKFYIDTNILAKNPDAYADSVLRMFGKVGGEVVLDSIKKNLVQKAGMGDDSKKFSSLRECVNAVSKRYRSL